MNEDFSTYEQIDEFLKGNLKGDALAAFHERMKSDQEFSDTVRAQKVVNEMILTKHLAELRGKMQQDLKSSHFDTETKKWKYGAGLAIVLVASVAVWQLNEKPETKETTLIKQQQPAIASVEQKGIEIETAPSPENYTEAKTQTPPSELPKPTSEIKETSNPIVAASETKLESTQAPVSIEKKPEVLPVVPSEKLLPTDECSAKKWMLSVETSPTCLGKSEGAIIIFDKEKNVYSIDEGKHFVTQKQFLALAQGYYSIMVRDNEGCEYKTEAEVKTKKCKTVEEIVFNPSLGNWIVPSKDNSDVEVTIVNKSGQLVWKMGFSFQQPEWDGKNNEGQLVPIGLYGFHILYSNGDTKEGYISVMY